MEIAICSIMIIMDCFVNCLPYILNTDILTHTHTRLHTPRNITFHPHQIMHAEFVILVHTAGTHKSVYYRYSLLLWVHFR